MPLKFNPFTSSFDYVVGTATSASGGGIKGKVTFDSDKGISVTSGVASLKVDAVTIDFDINGKLYMKASKLLDTDASNSLTLVWNENDTADRTLNFKVNAGNRTLDLSGDLYVESTSRLNQDLTTDAGVTFNDVSISTPVNIYLLNHDSFAGFVANEHIDHSTVSVSTAANTSGLTGGGNLTTTRNLAIDINGTTDKATPVANDELILSDSADSNKNKKADVASFSGAINHDSTNGFVSNEHIDHTTVSIATAANTSGLTGGGDISSTRNLALDITNTTDKPTPIAADEIILADSADSAKNKKADIGSLSSAIDHNSLTNTHNLTTSIDHNSLTNTHNLSTDIDHDGLTNTHNLTTSIDHNSITNTHNLSTDIDHNGLTNTHNLSTDIDHNGLTNTHNLSTDIDHDGLTNTHNLTTDIDHNSITNNHNLTTDIFVSTGDIKLTSFNIANNQVAAADVTGFAFANATIRSFLAHVSVTIDATADLFEEFTLSGIQRAADWQLRASSGGDSSGITFSITNAGQIQYTSGNYAGFSSGLIEFRAIITNIPS